MRRILKVAPILVCLPLLLGVSTCSPTDPLKNKTRLKFAESPDKSFNVSSDVRSVVNHPGGTLWTLFENFYRTSDSLREVCTDENKVVCDWGADPNNLRVFESTNGVNGHAWSGSPTDVENRVRCVQPRTAAGICEDYVALAGGSALHAAAVSVFDIGECSSSIPTKEFAALLAEQWRRGSEERLGTGIPPNSHDITLWTDLTVELKNGDFPPEVFFDWTVTSTTYGTTKSELITRNAYRVDGDLNWSLDRDWRTNCNQPFCDPQYDDSIGGTRSQIPEGMSRLIQGVVRFNPITFWLPLVLGNCEKDRPAVVQMRGELAGVAAPVEPTVSDMGGWSVDVNSTSTCGPTRNWPCSWSSVLDWPARPWCNNHVVGRIQDFLLSGAYAQFGQQPSPVTDDDGNPVSEPWCFSCTPDGGLTPFTYSDGDPLTNSYGERFPIRDIVLTPTRVHFVHYKVVPPDPSNGGTRDVDFDELDELIDFRDYLSLKTDGKCGSDRAIPAETVELLKQGEHL